MGVSGTALSPDGKWAATVNFKAADVRIWDLTRGREGVAVRSIPAGDRPGAVFSPDGRWLVVDEPLSRTRAFYEVGSWDVVRQEREVEIGGLVFAPDGRTMAASTVGARQVRLLDPADGREWVRLEQANSFRVWPVAFSRDGSRLAVGERRAYHLWDLREVRARLAEMGLDWDAPAYPPDPSDVAAPLPFRVDERAAGAAPPAVELPPPARGGPRRRRRSPPGSSGWPAPRRTRATRRPALWRKRGHRRSPPWTRRPGPRTPHSSAGEMSCAPGSPPPRP
jgi:hypothetical protein